MELWLDQDDTVEKFPEHIVLMCVICVGDVAQLPLRLLIDSGLCILRRPSALEECSG
jgi:hypothetical protein